MEPNNEEHFEEDQEEYKASQHNQLNLHNNHDIQHSSSSNLEHNSSQVAQSNHNSEFLNTSNEPEYEEKRLRAFNPPRVDKNIEIVNQDFIQNQKHNDQHNNEQNITQFNQFQQQPQPQPQPQPQVQPQPQQMQNQVQQNQVQPQPLKQGMKQRCQPDKILFSQFLNDVLDEHKNVKLAFQSIDLQNKGFIEFQDLAMELSEKFCIDEENQQKEIFFKLGEGNERIDFQIFESAFEEIVRDRQHQQEQVLSSMNVVRENYDVSHSPFKDRQEREEIINIFKNNQSINLDEANKIEHFDNDSKYAPVVRGLRQQPNFNEFVRSYNNLQFPQNQSSLGQSSHNPFSTTSSQQQQQQHRLLQRTDQLSHDFLTNPLARGDNVKTQTATFSPSHFYDSLTQEHDSKRDRNVNPFQKPQQTSNSSQTTGAINFASPQFHRKLHQSFLGQDYGMPFSYNTSRVNHDQKQSSVSYSNVFESKHSNDNNLANSKMFTSSELNKQQDYLYRSVILSPYKSPSSLGGVNSLFLSQHNIANPIQVNHCNLFDIPMGSKLGQSSYLSPRIADSKMSPNQKRLSKLKRNVDVGLNNLQQKNSEVNNLVSQNVLSSQKLMKDQFSQYLSQQGLAAEFQGHPSYRTKTQNSPEKSQILRGITSINQAQKNLKLTDEGDRFEDILQRISNGIKPTIQFQKIRQTRCVNSNQLKGIQYEINRSPFKNASMRNSQSPPIFRLSPNSVKGGIQGQMSRVKQIQASLRSFPKKTKQSSKNQIKPLSSSSFTSNVSQNRLKKGLTTVDQKSKTDSSLNKSSTLFSKIF